MDLDIARGLLASYATDLVKDRTRLPLIVFLVIGVGLLLVALALQGGFGIALAVLGVLACGIAAMVVVLRWLAVWSIKRLAPPVPGYQEHVAQAIEAVDLPTGPLSVVRLLNRLRKGGVDDEVDRLRQVLEDLGDEFDEN